MRFGITVQEIAPSLRKEMMLDIKGGVLVTKVEGNSFAADIGLMQRDVVVAVNREEIGSIEDLRNIQKALKPGQDVSFKLMRTDGREWVTLYLAGVVPE